jgi:hypothetical protein
LWYSAGFYVLFNNEVQLYFGTTLFWSDMYYERTAEKIIIEAAKHFKATLVVGSVKVGKRTIFKECTGFRIYSPMDEPRQSPSIEPPIGNFRDFGSEYPKKSILAEMHHEPHFFNYLRLHDQPSRFDSIRRSDILVYGITSSRQLNFSKVILPYNHKDIKTMTLLGLSLRELNLEPDYEPFLPTKKNIEKQRENVKKYSSKEIFEIIHRGSSPGINANKGCNWEEFYKNYLQTYVEKDIFEKALRDNYEKVQLF